MAAKNSFAISDDESPKEVAEVELAISHAEGNLSEGQQTLDLRALPEAVCKDNGEKESSMLYVAQSGKGQFEQTRQQRQDNRRLLSLGVARKLSQKPGKWKHTGAGPKDTQDIDPYSGHMIKEIESSRAEPFVVKSQTGQSEHGSLRFTINPLTQRHRSERDGLRDQQSSSSTRLLTEAEGSDIGTPVKSTVQMPGNLKETGARPKKKLDRRNGSGNQVSASSTKLVTDEPSLNSAGGSEMDRHIPSTIQMRALAESQPSKTGLPLATTGIIPSFLARHSTDEFLVRFIIPGNEPEGSVVLPPTDNSSPALGESQPSKTGLPLVTTGIIPSFLARHSTDEFLIRFIIPGNEPEGRSVVLPPTDNSSPALGESQPPMTGLPLTTPRIYPSFLARHSRAQSLCCGSAVNNNAASGNEPERRNVALPLNDNMSSETTSQLVQAVNDEENLVIDGHQFHTHRNVPTEHDDTSGWLSSMERESITRRWCSCFRLAHSDEDLRPICELCFRLLYRESGTRP